MQENAVNAIANSRDLLLGLDVNIRGAAVHPINHDGDGQLLDRQGELFALIVRRFQETRDLAMCCREVLADEDLQIPVGDDVQLEGVRKALTNVGDHLGVARVGHRDVQGSRLDADRKRAGAAHEFGLDRGDKQQVRLEITRSHEREVQALRQDLRDRVCTHHPQRDENLTEGAVIALLLIESNTELLLFEQPAVNERVSESDAYAFSHPYLPS